MAVGRSQCWVVSCCGRAGRGSGCGSSHWMTTWLSKTFVMRPCHVPVPPLLKTLAPNPIADLRNENLAQSRHAIDSDGGREGVV